MSLPIIPTINSFEMPVRTVRRAIEHPYDGNRYYFVKEWQKPGTEGYPNGGWKHISKGYLHSTSAFAAMGRIVQKEICAKAGLKY